MSAARLARWIVLLIALIGSISWSYIAINHLLGSSMTPADRAGQYDSAAERAHLRQMDLSQRHWGRQTMFAVACSFFFLLAGKLELVPAVGSTFSTASPARSAASSLAPTRFRKPT